MTLDGPPGRSVDLPVSITYQDGASDEDHSDIPDAITFGPKQTSRSFTFTVTDDQQDDGGESVVLGFGTLPERVELRSGGGRSLTITFTDDDTAGVTVDPTSLTITEGGSDTYTVVLNSQPPGDVTITPSVPTGADFSVSPQTLTFTMDNWDTEQTVTVQASQDQDGKNEAARSITHTVSGYGTVATADGVSVTVTDDDGPETTVQFKKTLHNVAESDDPDTADTKENEVRVAVTLSVEPERQVVIPIVATDSDTATLRALRALKNSVYASPQDYSLGAASVTFEKGETQKTITFTATPDTLDDDGEVVDLAIGTLPPGVKLGTNYSSTVRIDDDDHPVLTVAFENSAYAVDEGNDVSIKVTLSAVPERAVSIQISKTNDEASNADYSGVPAKLDFGAAETEKTITFTATDDNLDEDSEKVKLGFGSSLPDRITEGANDETDVTIRDNDTDGVTVSPTDLTVTEGGTGTYTVKLNTKPSANVTITLTNPSNTDITALPATLTFTPTTWGTTQTVTVSAAQDDDALDDTGTVTHAATSTDTAYNGIDIYDVDVTVTDDELAITVTFESVAYTVAEGANGSIKVKLSEDPDRTVVIRITRTNQGGASNSDYSGVPANVTFLDGETEKTITFSATDDTDDDDGEKVKLGFASSLPEKVTKGTNQEALVTITDNDSGNVTVSPTTLDIGEGSSKTYTVVLNSQPSGNVTITVGDPANTDVTASVDTLTFTASNWSTAQTVRVSVAQDTDALDETATVTHSASSADADYNGISVSSVTVNVTDDEDVPVTVTFEHSAYTVAERDDTTTTGVEEHKATIKIKLDKDPEREVIIPITATPQGTTSSDDFELSAASVTFNSGDTEKTITFTAKHDTLDDDGDKVKLSFGSLPGAVSRGTTSETVVSITDDDQTALTITFENSAYNVDEGSEVDIKVTLSPAPGESIDIPITKTHVGGATSDDYSGVPDTLTFGENDTEKTITFSATDDGETESGEEVTLSFSSTMDSRITAGSNAQATVRIFETSTQEQDMGIRFGSPAYFVQEGEDVEVDVMLEPAPTQDTTIQFEMDRQSGMEPGDYSGVPNSITFLSGESKKTITFTATDDDEEEGSETLSISFKSLPAMVEEDDPEKTNISIDPSDQKDNRNLGECDTQANKIILLEDTGEISQTGERDFWEVETEPRVIYIIEVLGADSGLDVLGEDTHSGDLTLADPTIISLHRLDSVTTTYSEIYGTTVENSGHGRNAVVVTRPGYGTIRIEVAASDGGTGTYQIKARVNNVCAVNEEQGLHYPLFGGPRGYRLDAAPDSTTESNLDAGLGLVNQPISRGGFLGDNWDDNPDVDWFRTEFQQGYEYTVDVWTEQAIPEKYQATQLRTLGINDENGDPVANTASEGSGKHASTVFRPAATATFYVSIGSAETLADGSENTDRDGLFSIRATALELDPGENLARHNSPASGGPTTDGEARVGRKLTAVTEGIQDEDGMENAVLTYQWIRLDLDLEGRRTDIPDATDSHYTPEAAEEGSAIGVQVSFTDDAGNDESLTSPLKLVLPPIPLTVSLTESPEAHDGTNAFSVRIAFSVPIKNRYKNVRDHAFQVTNGTVTLARRDDVDSRSWEIKVQPNGNDQVEILLPADRSCGRDGAICTKDGRKLQNALELMIPWPPNNIATGAPVITGTTQVGQTLEADTTGIQDEDGLEHAVFTYQWSAGGSDISDATGVSYKLTSQEEGLNIQVRVSFTDDAGNDESLTSPLKLVLPPTPLTVSLTESPEAHDGTNAFSFRIAFSDPIKNGYKNVRDKSFRVTNGTVTLARRDDGDSRSWEIKVQPDGNAQVEILLPADGSCGKDGAICTKDERKLQNALELMIPGPPNNPATGSPVITGTAQVGQTLGVDTTGIADADGLTNVSYSYQWMRNDGTDVTGIAGATNSSYTLVAADEGKTIQVVVSFTDDAGNNETLTSAATASVEAAIEDPRDTATDLGDVTDTSSTTYSSLQSLDGVDQTRNWYMFTLTAQKRVQLGLRQLDADATLTLENQDRDAIQSGSATGVSTVRFSQTLQAGTYYVRVDADEVAQNNYKLSWKAN